MRMKGDDFKLLRGFADERTDEQTFVIVESLSRMKNRIFLINLVRYEKISFCNINVQADVLRCFVKEKTYKPYVKIKYWLGCINIIAIYISYEVIMVIFNPTLHKKYVKLGSEVMKQNLKCRGCQVSQKKKQQKFYKKISKIFDPYNRYRNFFYDFSVAKVTLQLQMSVCLSVCYKNPSASQNCSY